MKIIVDGSKRINEAMGSFRITATETDEKKQEFRRSIVLARDMKKGEVIQYTDIDYKRPGTGIKPEMADFVIGRMVNKDLKYDHILSMEDII